MNINLDDVISAAATEYKQHLDNFWPSPPGNDVAEANQTHHVANALRASFTNERLDVFFEAPVTCTSSVNWHGHIDLFAISPTISFGVEAKRLHDTSTALSLFHDLERLENLRLKARGNKVRPQESYIIATATTCSLPIKDTFVGASVSKSLSSEKWLNLNKKLQSFTTGSLDLGKFRRDATANDYWLLYAWKKLDSPFEFALE